MGFNVGLKPLNGGEFGVNLDQVRFSIGLALFGFSGSIISFEIKIGILLCSDEALDLSNEAVGSSLERCCLLRSRKCSSDGSRGSTRRVRGISLVSLCSCERSLSVVERGLSCGDGSILFSGTSVTLCSSESSLSTISCSLHLCDQGVEG